MPRRHLLVLLCRRRRQARAIRALAPATAFADAAGPTDFRSRVVSVEPSAPALHLSVEGGDSFLMLRVERGTAVEVPGYQKEPYLRFQADGTVLVNRASPPPTAAKRVATT